MVKICSCLPGACILVDLIILCCFLNYGCICIFVCLFLSGIRFLVYCDISLSRKCKFLIEI